MFLRPDLAIIASIVEEGTKVLDIGCGEGELLKYLVDSRKVTGRGIELNQQNVSKCVSRGLSVVQGDADADLSFYPGGAFDYCILTQTLQATRDPRAVLSEMLRIGRKGIVSFPNFGFWKNRLYLLFKGRMPVTKNLSYEWYETPNIHFCTISDFVILCRELGIRIEKRVALTHAGEAVPFSGEGGSYANLFGEQGVFLLSR